IASLNKATERFRHLSGLPDWHVHDLRRTAATYMGDLGIPGPAVSRVLNHTVAGVTARYNRLDNPLQTSSEPCPALSLRDAPMSGDVTFRDLRRRIQMNRRFFPAAEQEMAMVDYKGRWRVRVIGKNSAWDQRVVITGAASGGGVIAGIVGTAQDVDGGGWSLNIEHNDGSGWKPNEGVLPDPLQEIGAEMRQVIRSKDHYTPTDTVPDDLVVQVDKMGPMFEIPVRPYAVDAPTLLMLADGIFVGINGLQYMGVDVRNSWGETLGDERLFDISDLGRATLASFGIVVDDAWSAASLQATGQVLVGRAIKLPPLQIGKTTTVYFQVDAGGARCGKPQVEFMLQNTGGSPGPDHPMRYAARAIFIADVTYDNTTGQAVARTPEGMLTLKLSSMMVDLQAVSELCGKIARAVRGGGADAVALRGELSRIIGQFNHGSSRFCDQRTLQELLRLLCRCLTGGDSGCGCGGPGGGGRGWPRICLPGGLWLPLKFEYGVEIKGGFPGQHGPLAFQDPWWKVVLLIIALIAWLVGLISQAVANQTGWANAGDLPKKIGTVGASNRVTTDACIIELDGSRPAQQSVADAITGEPNNQPILGLDTVIPIDARVAFPSPTSMSVVGKQVYKSGSRTGLTHGIIQSLGAFTQSRGSNGTPDPNHPDLVFALPQFTIAADPAFGEELFDDHGDSGSLVLSRDPATMNQVVGLLHSGNGGTSPIEDVINALGLKLRP
nr:hypothetical protein [Acidobacteriota bacterium]